MFIHGGAFIVGSNQVSDYGPDFLMTEDLVLVTINYRLGMLGLLRLDDPDLGIMGNMGLKDQRLSLKWIQNNISKFGGDPNNVTLAGESAGSRSAHYHILSPLSKGLFHKVVAQSAVTLSIAPPQPRINMLETLKKVGIDVKDETEALLHLEKLPVDQVFYLQEKIANVSFLNCIRFRFHTQLQAENVFSDSRIVSRGLPLNLLALK